MINKRPIFESIRFLNEAPITPEKIFGFYNNGIYNSIAVIDGKNYRNRVECLIFKNGKIFLAKDRYGKFIIPGGSAEDGISNIDQVANECKEEARICIKNIIDTNISYITHYENGRIPNYVKSLEHQWIGWYSTVFVAEFDTKYKGYIRDCDKDKRYLSGRFYNIPDVINDLREEWKDAINVYFKNNKS